MHVFRKTSLLPEHSLSRRFSYMLTMVVTGIVLACSLLVILVRFSQIDAQLLRQVERTSTLAETSLASAIWQFNPASIDDILHAIFTEESLVYARVISESDVLGERIHPDFSTYTYAAFQSSPQFIAVDTDIHHKGKRIGTFQFVHSRSRIRQELTRDIVLTAMLTLLLIMTISLTSIVLTQRYLLQPLRTLSHSAALMTDGALEDAELSESEMLTHYDEIGELARTFDGMRQHLHQMLLRMKEASSVMQTSSDDIFMTVNQLAAALEEQSSSVAETTSTMESMTATSRQISGNTDVVANMAEQTRSSSQKGVSLAEETIRKMQDIQQTNTRFFQKILTLGERTEKIDAVIELIHDIADRTKLIAFNAALEAVGSGDVGGRRFNVVAVEIRRLADSIIESTQEISSNILDIQQGTRELVLSSDRTTETISEGVQQTQVMNECLQEILEAAIRTTDEAKQIAGATQEQRRAHEHILLALKEISDATKQYASAGSQLSKSADDMKRMATDFHDLMSRFGFRQQA